VVANGRYFGSGMGIAPEASMTDGQFDVVILGKVRIIDYLKYFGTLRRCEKIDHPEVFYHRTNRLTVEHLDRPIYVEADGELEGHSPVEYECLQGALNFLIP
jgi:diacylglycerol kinase family enzyme